VKGQLSTFYASSVCLECQRSGAPDVGSVLAGRLEFMVLFQSKIRNVGVKVCEEMFHLCLQSWVFKNIL